MTNLQRLHIWLHKKTHSFKFLLAAIGICYLGIAAGGFYLGSRVFTETAKREAKERAEAQAEVAICYRRVQQAPELLKIFDAIESILDNQILTAIESIAAQPDSDLADIRRGSLRRSESALESVNTFRKQFEEDLPSKAECDALAQRLDVKKPTIIEGRDNGAS